MTPRHLRKKLSEIVTHPFNTSYFVSFPRTGRNWIRNILTDCGIPHKKDRLVPERSNFAPGITFAHDLGDWPYILDLTPDNFDQLFEPRRYDGRTIALMTRDPIAVTTSLYHWYNFLSGRGTRVPHYPRDIDEFLLSPVFGARKAAAFNKGWTRYLTRRGDGLILSYEECVADPAPHIARIANHFGYEVNAERIASAVQRNARENARAETGSRADAKLARHGEQRARPETIARLQEELARSA